MATTPERNVTVRDLRGKLLWVATVVGMQFHRVAVLDDIELPENEQSRLASLSETPIDFPADDPADDEVTQRRAAHADALVVSWRTPVGKTVFDACPQLRFVALAASAFAQPESCNIDLRMAKDIGVVVSTLGQYGDEPTAEWIIAMMLNCASHNIPLHWQAERRELFEKTLGIVGMGHMGREVAQRAACLGMRVTYWSRNRKPDVEQRGIEYRPLPDLLASSDVVSIHVGKGVQVMGRDEFAALKPGVMLVNTSLGPVMDIDAFDKWLQRNEGVVFSDRYVDPSAAALMRNAPNAWVSDQLAADSLEMKQRKGQQLYENMTNYLAGSPSRVAPL